MWRDMPVPVQVIAVRRRLANDVPPARIAAEFGTRPSTICSFIRRHPECEPSSGEPAATVEEAPPATPEEPAPAEVTVGGNRGPWTDDRVATLKALRAEGLSLSRIAARLGDGISRGAVIGKLNRLGLAGRSPAPRKDRAVKPRPATINVANRGSLGSNGPATKPVSMAGVSLAAVEPAPAPKPAPAAPVRAPEPIALENGDRPTLFTVSAEQCRWPLWPDRSKVGPDRAFVCGEPVATASSWCPRHKRASVDGWRGGAA